MTCDHIWQLKQGFTASQHVGTKLVFRCLRCKEEKEE